jgi:tRNA pseudouridine13 synthase
VNYYGLQRFGTSSIATHEIGVEILKENYAGAVDLLLKPREESARNSFLTETRKIWAETKDANAALDKLPRKYCNEGRVLFGLKDNPNDYVGALGRLARPMRQMYVHAVQSYIWNRLASYRLTLGDDILVGDLVQPNEIEKLKVWGGRLQNEKATNCRFCRNFVAFLESDKSYRAKIQKLQFVVFL